MTLQEQIEALDFVVNLQNNYFTFTDFLEEEESRGFIYDFMFQLNLNTGKPQIVFFKNKRISEGPQYLGVTAGKITTLSINSFVKQASFEEVFEAASEKLQTKLIYHLNLFL